MPIITNVMSAEILASMKANSETDSDKAQQKFADDLAGIITRAIRSADVIVPLGIPVTVVVPAGTGATTATSKASVT